MNFKEIGASEAISVLIVAGTVVGLSVGGHIVFNLRGSDSQAENVVDMISVASIDFKTEATGQIYENFFITTESRTRMKNIGTDSLKIRTDVVENRSAWSFVIENSMIINLADNEFWSWRPSADWQEVSWQDYADYYMDYSTQAGNQVAIILNQPAISSEEIVYEDNQSGMTVRIYDIQLNPTLSDSVFQPS